VKTPILPENGCAQRDVRRLVRFWPLRMPEKSTKISMAYYSSEFSHNLGREPPLTCASGLDVRDDDLADLRKDGR
jgi:hypothetical protein